MKKIINKKFNLPVIVTFLIGIVFGIIFIFFISEVDKLIIKSEIEEYLSLVSNSSNTLNSILNSFLKENIFKSPHSIFNIQRIILIFESRLYIDE